MSLESPFGLEGRSALVIGATSGIGAAVAVALARAGADVACVGHSRRPDAVGQRITELGRRALALQGDLADRRVPPALIDATVEAFERVDVLVNCAGIIRRAASVDTSAEDWDAVIGINLTSVFALCQATGRHMLSNGHGKIVNMASLLSFQGGLSVPAYAASKGGLLQLTRSLSNEWAGHGVNVNAIAPGYIRTENTAALQGDPTRSRQILDRIPAGRWGAPEDLTGAVVFLCSRASDYIHGHALLVDGGWMGR